MAEYRSNSHKSKENSTASTEREKRFDKVVSGNVKTKKNNARKLTDIFIAEDINTVKEHLFMDVFVPTAKKFISEIARDAVDMLLYGKVQGSKGGAANKVQYSKYYGGSSNNNNDRFAGSGSSNTNSRFNYDDLVFDSRGAAETVLTRMREAVQEYRLISVADMYDMAGLAAPWTSARYGWTATALEHAEVTRNPEGYVIKLPKASPFD